MDIPQIDRECTKNRIMLLIKTIRMTQILEKPLKNVLSGLEETLYV